MAIRFVPKTAEDLKAEAASNSPAPQTARAPISEAPVLAKPTKPAKAKRKPGASEDDDAKAE